MAVQCSVREPGHMPSFSSCSLKQIVSKSFGTSVNGPAQLEKSLWIGHSTLHAGERQTWRLRREVRQKNQIDPILPPLLLVLFLWSAFWTVFVADQFHLICLLIFAIVILGRHAVLFISVSFRCFCLSYSGGLSSASGFAFRLECLSSCRCFECEIKRRWIPVKKNFLLWRKDWGLCKHLTDSSQWVILAEY